MKILLVVSFFLTVITALTAMMLAMPYIHPLVWAGLYLGFTLSFCGFVWSYGKLLTKT